MNFLLLSGLSNRPINFEIYSNFIKKIMFIKINDSEKKNQSFKYFSLK